MPLPSNGSMDQCVSRLNRNQEHDGADMITLLRAEVDVQTERADELADEHEQLRVEFVDLRAKLKEIEAFCDEPERAPGISPRSEAIRQTRLNVKAQVRRILQRETP